MSLPKIIYGAIFQDDNERGPIAFVPQEEFMRALKLAYFETRDLDQAIERVRAIVAAKVREAIV